jgi:glycosyltransferase involved in cell wall biosynthesis
MNASAGRETIAWRAYERARDAVLRMKGGSAPGAEPSAYWAEELGNIDYMIEASPLVIRKLRHHAFHITGIRPYDYRTKDDTRRAHFDARLHALREMGGDALVVPESPELGGFGYEIGGRLFNVDTIKFLEVLVGMEKGGVLPQLRALGRRATVCEIGAGWGGFAYQFKTLLPDTTYVVVDFPELFLFSATYLATVFPGARTVFCASPADVDAAAWRGADFVFVPHTLAPHVSRVPLDLTINMVSFQEMTDAQVRGYAAMAADAGCPLLYSLNRERSPYNTELSAVSQALSTRYRLSEVQLLETDYTSAMKKPPKPGRPAERTEFSYRHYVGRLPSAAGPRVVLGMTLYNNARYLPEALDSLLAQTHSDFVLVLLDDCSPDGTAEICRDYAARDRRVRFFRHEARQAMIATWHEVVEVAARECPSAEYFAWVSDHDRWHPEWLAKMLAEMEAHPEGVLAYPITQRITPDGVFMEKGPRLFDTAGLQDPRARWARFCRDGVGSGDMIYGLMRLDALRRAGIFRTVLRPDRLLVAEMSLYGEIRQVPEVLWFRRQFAETSIARQRQTLVLPGRAPRWFAWPPFVQHSLLLYRVYAQADPPPLPIAPREWLGMIARYQFTYASRHFRKSETSHAFGRAVKRVVWTKKITKHHYHHAVYDTLVGLRALRGRARRARRQAVYDVLVAWHRVSKEARSGALGAWAGVRRLARRSVYHLLTLTHRAGLRGRGETPSQ